MTSFRKDHFPQPPFAKREPLFVPDLWAPKLLDQFKKESRMSLLFATPCAPLTRLQRISLRLHMIADRVRDAYLVLIGKREVI